MKILNLACLLVMACVLSASAAQNTAPAATDCTVTFGFWADDGARLFVDGQKLIDDWRPCAETEPSSHRIATVKLSPGYHRVVAEYFQGESLATDDTDPAKLTWAIPELRITAAVVPASCFYHTDEDEQDYAPSQGLSATDLARLAKGELTAASSGGSGAAMKSGLVAHYFRDPAEWSGNWKPRTVPTVNAKDWTFREYAYSRVEPVINHLFANRGWFSIRWVGYVQVGTVNPPANDNPSAGTGGNNGVGNGVDPAPPGNPPPNDLPGTGPGNPGNQNGNGGNGANNGNGGQGTQGNNGVGNGVDPAPPGNPPPNDLPGTGPGNPGNQNGNGNTGGNNGNGQQATHGNNGVGNGVDPAPPGNPKPNDLAGTAPGNPGNKTNSKSKR